ncbi:MAG: hypothetical protein IJI10_07725 [Eubacterium sp.]|nr:hypothetical protein [Eubacterium sp.]
MKTCKKKCLLLALVMIMVIQSALPASAATRWYTYNRCANTTVQINVGKAGNYKILSQEKGVLNLYNWLRRKYDKTAQAYGSYRVTIVQVKDANGRSINKKICTNRLWASGEMHIKLTKGTYRVTVRGLGYVSFKAAISAFHEVRCWKKLPRWRLM